MARPEVAACRRPTARRLWIAASALAALLVAAPVQAQGSYELRYGFAPGQTWHAVQTVVSETTVGDVSDSRTGTARFRYDVSSGAAPGEFRLDARMLSQETEEGPSPFDFSVIHFFAQTDARGVMRGRYFQLGEAEPPPLEGVEADPVAFREMLRSLASAWLESVYWLPVLPEKPLAVGESFELADRGDVAGVDPGVSMQMQKKTVYRLRKVTGRLAEFSIREHSTVDAATARSGIVSNLSAEGEAVFDLESGMWLRREIRSSNRASVRGAESGADRARAHSVTIIEMRPGEPADS
jgi:hypothetical protein